MDTEKKSTLFLFGLFLFIMLVGLFGVALTPKWSEPLANNIYAVAGLFAFSGDWSQDLYKTNQMNFFIEFARFAAPLTTALIFFVLIFDGARQLLAYLLRPRSDFEVVIGLGNKGSAIAFSALEQGKKVIAVELQSNNNNVALLKRNGAIVITGDLNANVIKKLNFSSANNIFFCCGEDNKNIATAEQILPYLKPTSPLNTPQIFVHLHSRVLADRLKQHPRIKNNALELRFWRKSQILAEQLFERQPLDYLVGIQGAERVNIVIFGSNDAALDLARSVAKNAIYSSLKTAKIILVTHLTGGSLSAEVKAIAAAADLELIDTDIAELIGDSERLINLLKTATQIYIFDTDGLNNYSVALQLRNFMFVKNLFMAPINYATNHTEIGATTKNQSTIIPDGLYAFNDNSKDINISAILQPQGTILAKRTHEHSYQSQSTQQLSWEALSYSLKEANREFAVSWGTKLAAVGVQFSSENCTTEFSNEELEIMSAMEHTRWCAERKIDGWQYHEVRSNFTKKHPLLKPWSELSGAQQKGNTDFFASALTDLQSMSKNPDYEFGLKRIRTIAVTGHRFTKLKREQHDQLVKNIDAELLKIKQANPNCTFQLISALAEGSDRLVVERAKKVLNAPFIALLPMPYELYKLDFENEENDEFESYIARAAWYAHLPPIYNHVSDVESSSSDARAKQYAVLAGHLVAMADDLIAVWDGEQAKGLGGTADVVNWWQGSVPTEYKVNYASPTAKRAAYIVYFRRDT